MTFLPGKYIHIFNIVFKRYEVKCTEKRHFDSFPCSDGLSPSAAQLFYYSLPTGTLISLSVQTLHSVIAGCNIALLM